VEEVYRSTDNVNYIWQMLKYNDWCTSLYYMQVILRYLALQGWYCVDTAKVFNLKSSANTECNTCWAHLLHLQHSQAETFFWPVLQQVHHWREINVCAVCRKINLTILRDASEGLGISNFGQLFHAHIEEDWGHKVGGLVLGYDQNVLRGSIYIKRLNGLLYYPQPFHCPTSVKPLGLDCMVEYNNANQGMIQGSHDI